MAAEVSGTAPVTRSKRRYRTKLERRQIIEELLVPGAKTAAVAKAHGIRASQVNHWRRLYKQGLLEVEASSTALVPVRISDGSKAAVAPRIGALGQNGPTIGRPSTGKIQLTLERAHL